MNETAARPPTSTASEAPPARKGGASLGFGLMALLTAFQFTAAATIHYQTPLLAEFGREFGAGADRIGWVPTLSFGGFLFGTLLLVPLGDRFDKRRLILTEVACLILALLAMAGAPTLGALLAASFAIGLLSSVVHLVIPIIAELAAPSELGRAVGTSLSGVFIGILFGRLFGGAVASRVVWRWVYVISAGMLVLNFAALLRWLPGVPPKTVLRYGALLRSLVRLLRERTDLRRASRTQCLLGICYGGFWATLAPMLASLHGLGPAAAGLIAIPGGAGILVARPAGRWMDRSGVAPVVTGGVCLILVGYLTLGFAGLSIAAVAAGAALQDCGLRATMVANQALVTGTDPESRSRSLTVFSVHVWAGNAAGGFIASNAFARAGWFGVCASGVVASALALALHLWSRRAVGR